MFDFLFGRNGLPIQPVSAIDDLLSAERVLRIGEKGKVKLKGPEP